MARGARRLALAVILGAGCAHARTGDVVVAPDARGWLVVPHMTLVAQRGDTDCGPAALTMALGRWSAAPSPDAWQPRAGEPAADDGVTAGALRDEARREGFQSYVFEGTFEDLGAEIGAGHPVIVGLVRLRGHTATPHFAVVVGRDTSARRWLVADPAEGVQMITRAALEAEWARGGRVTLVLAPKAAEAASHS